MNTQTIAETQAQLLKKLRDLKRTMSTALDNGHTSTPDTYEQNNKQIMRISESNDRINKITHKLAELNLLLEPLVIKPEVQVKNEKTIRVTAKHIKQGKVGYKYRGFPIVLAIREQTDLNCVSISPDGIEFRIGPDESSELIANKPPTKVRRYMNRRNHPDKPFSFILKMNKQ